MERCLRSILLWIFDRWSPYSYQNNKEKYKDDPEEEKREFTLKESLWFCMTSLTPQVGAPSLGFPSRCYRWPLIWF